MKNQTNAIQTFNFENKEVRIVIRDSDPWFVAKDVCRVLGLAHTGSVLRDLEDDEKDVHTTHTPGGNQRLSIVSESGLYAFIFKSRKEVPRRFSKWVRSEVLTSIRKNGSYSIDKAPMSDESAPTFGMTTARQSLVECAAPALAEIVAPALAEIIKPALAEIVEPALDEIKDGQLALKKKVNKMAYQQAKADYERRELKNGLVRIPKDNHDRSNYLAVQQFAKLNGLKLSHEQAISYSLRALHLSNGNKGSINSKEFGRVNTYPRDALEVAFHNESLQKNWDI